MMRARALSPVMSLVAALAVASALGGCSSGKPPAPKPEETRIPDDLKAAPARTAQPGDQVGTPMAEREATLGLLNKRNNLSQDIKLKPGESRRLGDIIIRLDACERTAPWEMPAETGTFVQVLVQRKGKGEEGKWDKIFSGWLFKNAPSLNVVEHPVYDVWVKDCAMSFPGQEAPVPSSGASSTAAPSRAATATASPAPTPSASPSAAAAPANAE